jgi:hypothetical protein
MCGVFPGTVLRDKLFTAQRMAQPGKGLERLIFAVTRLSGQFCVDPVIVKIRNFDAAAVVLGGHSEYELQTA